MRSTLTVLGLILPLALLVPRSARAQVELSFPLGQHFRVGKYLPVKVEAPPWQGAGIRIEAGGAMPVELSAQDGAVEAVVPLLAFTTLGPVKYETTGGRAGRAATRLVALQPDQQLVGVASDSDDLDDLLRELFPAKRIVRVALNPVNPLPGPIVGLGSQGHTPSITASRSTSATLQACAHVPTAR